MVTFHFRFLLPVCKKYSLSRDAKIPVLRSVNAPYIKGLAHELVHAKRKRNFRILYEICSHVSGSAQNLEKTEKKISDSIFCLKKFVIHTVAEYHFLSKRSESKNIRVSWSQNLIILDESHSVSISVAL